MTRGKGWQWTTFVVSALALAAVLLTAPRVDAQSGTMQRITYGEVVVAERATVQDRATGRGSQTGATVGAVAGYALADRGDRWLGALLGGAVGSAVGHSAEKRSRRKQGWQLIIRLDSGEEIGIQVTDKSSQFLPGDRVRLMTGAGGRTQVTRVAR